MRLTKLLFTLAALTWAFSFSFAQKVTIPVTTKNLALVLQAEKKGEQLKIIHLGAALNNPSEYEISGTVYTLQAEGASSNTNAFAVAGINNNFTEPAMAVVHADGNNSVDLRYE
ncbi:MAG TPA: hypothetical protein PK167_11925, partial [Prolixibacteraceae bacterium]|nr:hypothetical protein [Prolixibacteraceae bacterium]